jgi:hypothetical protein
MLSHIHDGFMPDPQNAIAVVAQADSRELVGRVFIVAPAHVEGIYIRREYRDKTLMQRLVKEAEIQAKLCGLTQLLAFGKDEEMTDYINRLGYVKQPWTVSIKELT